MTSLPSLRYLGLLALLGSTPTIAATRPSSTHPTTTQTPASTSQKTWTQLKQQIGLHPYMAGSVAILLAVLGCYWFTRPMTYTVHAWLNTEDWETTFNNLTGKETIEKIGTTEALLHPQKGRVVARNLGESSNYYWATNLNNSMEVKLLYYSVPELVTKYRKDPQMKIECKPIYASCSYMIDPKGKKYVYSTSYLNENRRQPLQEITSYFKSIAPLSWCYGQLRRHQALWVQIDASFEDMEIHES